MKQEDNFFIQELPNQEYFNVSGGEKKENDTNFARDLGLALGTITKKFIMNCPEADARMSCF